MFTVQKRDRLLFNCVHFFVGVIILHRSWILFQQVVASVYYEKVIGVVEESYIETIMNADEGDDYVPCVRYAYQVDGRTYRGDRFAMRRLEYNSNEKADRVVEKYSAGSRVTVYYDPGDPACSVLWFGLKSPYYAIGFLVGFLVVFLVVFDVWIFKRREVGDVGR